MSKSLLYILVIGAFFYFYDAHIRKGPAKAGSSVNSSFSGSAPKVLIISYQGESVLLEDHAVSGGVTVFDFYADWCGPCKALAPELEAYVQRTSGVFLRKINIKNWDSPVARDYGIRSIPSLRIYDQRGREAYPSVRGMDEIIKAVEKLKR